MGKIYAFEDEASIRDIYARLGQAAKIDVRVFESPSRFVNQPLEAIAADLADVDGLITDREMPNMDGFTLIDTVRRAGYVRPILMVSGGMKEQDIERFADLSAAYPKSNLYLLDKPVELMQVLGTMKQMVANGTH